jgi:hypothetical protein
MEAELRIQAARDLQGEYAALIAWLNADRDLRGHLRQRLRLIGENDLGAATDAVVATLGSGAGIALGRAVVQFVSNHRSDITIVVTRGEKAVSVTASRVQQVENLLAQVLRDADGA